jgi:hypothetical protein
MVHKCTWCSMSLRRPNWMGNHSINMSFGFERNYFLISFFHKVNNLFPKTLTIDREWLKTIAQSIASIKCINK